MAQGGRKKNRSGAASFKQKRSKMTKSAKKSMSKKIKRKKFMSFKVIKGRKFKAKMLKASQRDATKSINRKNHDIAVERAQQMGEHLNVVGVNRINHKRKWEKKT